MRTVSAHQVALEWDDHVLATHSNPHFMQSSTWQRVRRTGPWAVSPREFGTRSRYPVVAYERYADGFGVLQHLPRVSGLRAEDVPDLTDRIRTQRGAAFATKIEIYQPRDEALVAALLARGWRPARASQYRFAVVVETGCGEAAILAGMKKRARSEIRTAERHGVEVRRVELTPGNRDRMFEMMRETELRSGAFFRGRDYVESVWTSFVEDGRGRLVFASHEGNVVAGAFVATYGTTGWYKDGGSLRDRPELMASRLLQWGIMRDLAADGIVRYDLGHVVPPSEPDAPAQGVIVFKGAFAREVVEYMPAFQLAHADQAEPWRRGESDFLARHRERTGDFWY